MPLDVFNVTERYHDLVCRWPCTQILLPEPLRMLILLVHKNQTIRIGVYAHSIILMHLTLF